MCCKINPPIIVHLNLARISTSQISEQHFLQVQFLFVHKFEIGVISIYLYLSQWVSFTFQRGGKKEEAPNNVKHTSPHGIFNASLYEYCAYPIEFIKCMPPCIHLVPPNNIHTLKVYNNQDHCELSSRNIPNPYWLSQM